MFRGGGGVLDSLAPGGVEMKLSKIQRERHKGAALEMLERLEHRLTAAAPGKNRGSQMGLAERVGLYRQRLGHSLRDKDLLQLNLELSDLFYRSNNADKRGVR